MRYAVYLLQDDGSYRDQEATFEADNPREAAQRAFDQLSVHPDEQFPQLLVVPDHHVHVFSRNDCGRAVAMDEDIDRMIAEGPRTEIVSFEPADLRDEP